MFFGVCQPTCRDGLKIHQLHEEICLEIVLAELFGEAAVSDTSQKVHLPGPRAGLDKAPTEHHGFICIGLDMGDVECVRRDLAIALRAFE